MKKAIIRISLINFLLCLSACTSVPQGIEPVSDFELPRYLGTWYEIARLDHSFERGLDNVTANYSMREDGGVKVINRGFETATGKWDEAEGRAYFVQQPDIGHLKVSFFGPFFGAYVIFDLGSHSDPEHYQYSLVAGPDRSYFWILARQPELDPALLGKLLQKAEALGFDTSQLIYPKQNLH